MNIKNLKSTPFFLKVTVIVIVILTAIIAFFGSQGTVSIASSPSPVKVTIEGKEYQTPFTTSLRVGEHMLRATKEGYITIEETIRVEPFSTKNLSIPMISGDNESIEYARIEALKNFPLTQEHFRIEYTADVRQLEIIPRIAYYSEEPPTYYFKTYWNEYQQYGKEALQWLNSNGLDAKIREENQITIKWFGTEWWPQGAQAPSL